MRIIVGTRSTPDTAARLEVAADGSVKYGDSPLVINPWDEYAVEEALVQAKAHGGSVTVVAVGPEVHNEALKHTLAMGADEAIRLWDESWAGMDSLGYAAVFAAAAQKIGDVDLILFGKEAADEAADQHIFQTARKLGWPAFGYVSKILALDPGGKTLKVQRLLEQGRQTVSGKLPAVINVVKEINEPRYPSFMGIRKAAKAVIPVWGSADLGVTPPAPKAQVVSFGALPARHGVVKIIDGATAEEQAKKLVDALLAEKVI